MKQTSLFRWANPLFALSVVLYLIALYIGITNQPWSYALLLVADSILTFTVIEAVYKRRSPLTLFFRLMAFFTCWASTFENQKEPALQSICGILAFACGIIIVFGIIYYLNKYGTRDAEAHLDDI